MRIVADYLAVLAGSGFGFVGVDDEKARTSVFALFWHERPFEAGREASTTTTTKTGSLHFLDDIVMPARDQRLGVIPVATLLRRFQAPVLKAIQIGEDAVLIGKHQNAPPCERR